jgi:hypothetical protein
MVRQASYATPAGLIYDGGSTVLTAIPGFFRDLEERLLQSATRRSPEEVGSLLAVDFVEFGSSGSVYDRQQVIDGLGQEQPMERSVTAFAVRELSKDTVLVTYRAERRDPLGGREWHSLRSSIWRLTDGGWQMIFHQGTAIPPRK